MQINIQLGMTSKGPTKTLNIGFADATQGPLFMISVFYHGGSWEPYNGRVIFRINGPKWNKVLQKNHSK